MNSNGRNTRLNDYPELQVGFPERNDVRNPVYEMERIHVDLESLELSKTNFQGIAKEIISRPSISLKQ
jgi:hypothetical protein